MYKRIIWPWNLRRISDFEIGTPFWGGHVEIELPGKGVYSDIEVHSLSLRYSLGTWRKLNSFLSFGLRS